MESIRCPPVLKRPKILTSLESNKRPTKVQRANHVIVPSPDREEAPTVPPAAANAVELVSSSSAPDGEAGCVRGAPGEQAECDAKPLFALDALPPQAQIAIPSDELVVRSQALAPPPLASSSGGAETTGAPATDPTLNCVERPAGSAGQHATAPPPGSPPRTRALGSPPRARVLARDGEQQVSPTGAVTLVAPPASAADAGVLAQLQAMLAELDTLPTASAVCGNFFLAHTGARVAALGSVADEIAAARELERRAAAAAPAITPPAPARAPTEPVVATPPVPAVVEQPPGQAGRPSPAL